MVFISHVFVLVLASFPFVLFCRPVAPGQAFKHKLKHNKSGHLNLQFSMDNKKQVFVVLNDWLQTPGGMAQKHYVHHHRTGFHTLILQWCVVKCQASSKNSVFLSLLWASPHFPISPLLPYKPPCFSSGGVPSPRGISWIIGTLVPLVPEKTQEISVFTDRAEPRNEVAQLPGQRERHTQRETCASRDNSDHCL